MNSIENVTAGREYIKKSGGSLKFRSGWLEILGRHPWS